MENPTDANQQGVISNQQGVNFRKINAVFKWHPTPLVPFFPQPERNSTVSKSQWFTGLRKSDLHLVQKTPEAFLSWCRLDIILGLNILFSRWHLGLSCIRGTYRWAMRWLTSEGTSSKLSKYILLKHSLGVARSWPGLQSKSPNEQSSSLINSPENVNQNFRYSKHDSWWGQ